MFPLFYVQSKIDMTLCYLFNTILNKYIFLGFGLKKQMVLLMFSIVYRLSSMSSYNFTFFFRKDIKDIKEDMSEHQQSSYAHCKYLFKYSDLNI